MVALDQLFVNVSANNKWKSAKTVENKRKDTAKSTKESDSKWYELRRCYEYFVSRVKFRWLEPET